MEQGHKDHPHCIIPVSETLRCQRHGCSLELDTIKISYGGLSTSSLGEELYYKAKPHDFPNDEIKYEMGCMKMNNDTLAQVVYCPVCRSAVRKFFDNLPDSTAVLREYKTYYLRLMASLKKDVFDSLILMPSRKSVN